MIGIIGLTGLVISLGSIPFSMEIGIPGVIVSTGVLLIAAWIASKRNEITNEGTTLRLLTNSNNIPSNKWTFYSPTVDSENVQKFVKIVTKNIN